MLQEDQVAVAELDGPLVPPSPVMLTGLAVTGCGWLWTMAAGPSAATLGVVLLVVGMLLVGVGLALHLSSPRKEDDGAWQTPGWWLLAAVAAFAGSLGLEGPADSMALLARVFALVAVVAAGLSALPPVWRWLAVSALVVFHFFAIFTATMIIAPPAGPPPWLASQLWTRFTRPYLQLTHLNNAYHFYAPEPGPVALLWFRVKFADGAVVWVRLPDHQHATSHIERRREGSLASTMAQSAGNPPTDQEIKLRDEAAQLYDPPFPPRPSDLPIEVQYRDPGNLGRLLLASMVRYVARTTAHPDGQAAPVEVVKCYRGEFSNPPVEHFQAGRPPLDPTLYRAWYLGNYDPQGKLLDSSKQEMLYWMIPILREAPATAAPQAGPGDRAPGPAPWTDEGKVVNFLRIHAGDGNREDVP